MTDAREAVLCAWGIDQEGKKVRVPPVMRSSA
jgi:hypothetical protein